MGILQLKAVDPNNDASPHRWLKIKPREGEAITLSLELNAKDTWASEGIWKCFGEVGDESGQKKTQGARVLDLLQQYSPKGLTYKEIDAKLNVGKSLYQVLDRLEDRQLVTKRRSEFNSRQWVYAVPQTGGDSPPPPVDLTANVETPQSVDNTGSQQFNNQFNINSTPIQPPTAPDEVLNAPDLDAVSNPAPIQQPDSQGGGEGVLDSTEQVLNSVNQVAIAPHPPQDIPVTEGLSPEQVAALMLESVSWLQLIDLLACASSTSGKARSVVFDIALKHLTVEERRHLVRLLAEHMAEYPRDPYSYNWLSPSNRKLVEKAMVQSKEVKEERNE